MNVGELIEKLKAMPATAKVYHSKTFQEELDDVTLFGEGEYAYVELDFTCCGSSHCCSCRDH